ncbi:TPA: hypothetical protein DCW38_08285 [candidate division WOR-3 bacterium]|jgi:hypothetical protein|uniref:O-antigen ligase domain-containing protein n=1 Tax=candidate division WOR-3 bacterium TaxID=2052148 RepID=A0A350HC91_UNCW3|nr:hypothetical protein [candidate division WOR-3 bacterium]
MNEKLQSNIYKIVFAVAIAILLFFFGQADVMKIGLIGAVMIVLLVITNIQLSIVALIVVAFTFNFLSNVKIIPGKMMYAYDLLVYLLFLFSLINGKKKVNIIEIFTLLYIGFIIISTAFGREVLPLKMKGLEAYIKYPILFLALLRLKLSSETFKFLIKVVILFSIAQVFTSIFQYSKGNFADWCGGFLTRYASGSNAVLMTMMFLLILGWIMVDKLRLRYIFMSIFFMIPLVLSSARAGFIFFIISAIFMFLVYMLHIKYSSAYAMLFTIIGIVILLVAFYYVLLYIVPIFEPKNANTVSLISSPDMIKKDITGRYQGGQLRRWSSVLFAYNYLTADALKLFVGNGPGTVAISGNFGWSSFMQQFEPIFDPSVSLPTFLLELGIGGVSIILIIFFYVIIFSLNRAIYIEDKFLRVVGFALPGISVIMIFASIYTNVWDQEALQLVYWLFVASIVEPAEKAVKKDKVSALIFLKEIPINEKPTVATLINALYKYEIRTIYVAGRENDPNMLWLIDNMKKYEDLKIKWIRIMGYESMTREDILNIITNHMYADLLIIDGSDIPFDFRVIKRFIDTHRNVFALKYSDAEKKECDYCIAKIKRKSILKLSYFLKGRDPEIETDPLIDLFNSQDGTEMGFVNWNFLLSKTEENPEIKAVENV